MNITDEMVEVATNSLRDVLLSKLSTAPRIESPAFRESMRAALEAVAPLIAAAVWDEGFEAGATWEQSSPSGIPHDPPLNPHDRVKP